MSAPEPGTTGGARSVALLAVGAAAVAAVAVAMSLHVAQQEWFSRDDFAMILYARRRWSWLGAFWPVEHAFWWTWRPLGMDAYFRLCLQAFGLDAFRWFAVELAFHFALAPAAYAIARRLDFGRPAAVMAGMLAILAPPSLGGLYYGSVFHYVAANLFGALALLLFQTTLRADTRPGRAGGALAGSAVLLAAALLCNEAALVVPPVAALLALRARGRDIGAVARRVAPLLLVAVVYLVLRLAVFDLRGPPDSYGPHFGPNLIRHFWMQPIWLTGSMVRLAVVLAAMLGILGLALGAARQRPGPLRQLLGHGAVLLPWLLLSIAVFATLRFSAPRFAITLQLPGALLFAAHLDALWRLYGERFPRILQAAFVALLFVALPLDAMHKRLESPWGAVPRDFVQGVALLHPRLAPGTDLVVLYGGPELAHPIDARRVRRRTFGGSAIKATRDEPIGAVRFVDIRQGMPECARCAVVALGPDLSVRRPPDRAPDVPQEPDPGRP